MTDELERAPDGEPAAAETPAVEVAVDAPIVPGNAGDASLLGLIDRLGSMLERSDLSELEVEVGGTALVLRKPVAVAAPILVGTAVATDPASATAAVPASTPAAGAGPDAPAAPSRPSITAPLTGIWYASPAPGSAPFVDAGREVAVGQVVGLIEVEPL